MWKKRVVLFLVVCHLFAFCQQTLLAKPNEAEQTINAIEDIDGAGVYPIELTFEESGGVKTEVRYITVVDRRTEVNKLAHEVVNSYDVEILTGTFEKLTDRELMEKAQARGWSSLDAKPLKLAVVSKKKVHKEEIYEVIFETENKTAITSYFYERNALYANYLEKNNLYFLNYSKEYIYLSTVLLSLLLLTIISTVVFLLGLYKKTIDVESLLYEENVK